MLASEIESHRRQGSSDWRLDDLRARGDRVAVAFSWRTPDGSRTRFAQVLTLKGDRISALRDYSRPARAMRAVGA